VRHSTIHGHGVFATAAIPRGRFIGRFAGRRYSPEQAAALDWSDWDEALTYLFGLADGSVIDGGEGGNATRHLNHSCAPNCQAFETLGEDGLSAVEIETLKAIAPGAELLLDYALQLEGAEAGDFPCRCGARRCRGSLLAPPA
jgi:SET domain-containing protein